jgi:hypothetical protein
VLERVETFEYCELGIAACAPEARYQRSLLHAAIIAGTRVVAR